MGCGFESHRAYQAFPHVAPRLGAEPGADEVDAGPRLDPVRSVSSALGATGRGEIPLGLSRYERLRVVPHGPPERGVALDWCEGRSTSRESVGDQMTGQRRTARDNAGPYA